MDISTVLSQEIEEKVSIYQCKHCKNVIGNDRFKVETYKDDKTVFLKGNKFNF